MTENQKEKTPPTKAEMISWLKEQISVRRLQAELQEYSARIAQHRLQEMECLAKMGQLSGPQNETPSVIEHEVSQKDLDNNPELVKANIKVGDKIGIPAEAYEEFQNASLREEEQPSMSIVE